jgi:hypothetical protein
MMDQTRHRLAINNQMAEVDKLISIVSAPIVLTTTLLLHAIFGRAMVSASADALPAKVVVLSKRFPQINWNQRMKIGRTSSELTHTSALSRRRHDERTVRGRIKFTSWSLSLTLITTASTLAPTVYAQSLPAATQQLQLSAFVAGTDTFTYLAGGKNLDITAGVDLTLPIFRVFSPSVEVRGTYPIDKGHISSQKDFLVGPKIEYPFGRLHPYADLFVGRGKIDYHASGHASGYIFDNFRYVSSTTIVYSPGIGLDYRFTNALAVKIDAQFQHWNTPATNSGTINPRAITLGAIYNFDFNQGHRHGR